MSAGIVDLARAGAGPVVGNDRFAAIGLTDEWIVRRSGISSRIWLDDDASAEELAAEACRPLVARAPDPGRIDALILVSTSNRRRIPAAAPTVAALAGLGPAVLAWDLNAACCGFVYALTTGLALCDAGRANAVLVCSVELMSRVVDRTDRQTACLFGDGAAAVLIESRADFPAARHVAGCDAAQEGLMRELPGGGIHLDGVEVYDRAVRHMVASAQHLAALDPAPTVIVGHQANGRILQQVGAYLEPLGVPVVNRIAGSGNTSSASIPLALADDIAAGSTARSGRLCAVAYGAGDAWGGVSVSYELPAVAA